MGKQPGISRNTKTGRWIYDVETLGYVPPCVRDAFSWLPHGWIKHGRGKSARLVWDWQTRDGGPHQPQTPDSDRCTRCIFQEPKWSQGYAGCSHSWLHDRDGDCRAFVDAKDMIERDQRWATFCHVPVLDPSMADGDDVALLITSPYLPDGTRWMDLTASCNIPSSYYAQLNMPAFLNFFQDVYGSLEIERLRRFRQWSADEIERETGFYQYNMFLSEM